MAVNPNGNTNISNAFNIFDNNFEKNISGGGNVASTASADLLNLKSAISSDTYELSPSQVSVLETDVDNLMGMIGKSGDGSQWQQAVTQLASDIASFTGSAPSKVAEDASSGGAYESSYAATYSAMSTPDGGGAVSDSTVSAFAQAAGAAGVSGALTAAVENAVSTGSFAAFMQAAAQVISTDSNNATDGVLTDLQQMVSAFTSSSSSGSTGGGPISAGAPPATSHPAFQNALPDDIAYATTNGYVAGGPGGLFAFFDKDGKGVSSNEPTLKQGDYLVADGSSWQYNGSQLVGVVVPNPPPQGVSVYTLQSDNKWYDQNGKAA